MKKVNFTFTSSDGKTIIHAVKWIPNSGEYKAILQITHGMVEFIERYEMFAEYMTEQGFMVVGHDHLGHGDSVVHKEKLGYIAEESPSDKLVSDMHKLRKSVQGANRNVPYFMLGHSMGSFLLRKYLMMHNENIDGAIIMGTGHIPSYITEFGKVVCNTIAAFSGWEYRSKLVERLSFGSAYKKYDLSGKTLNNSWLTKDEEIVKFYYSEPKCKFSFTLNGYYALFDTITFDNNIDNINKIPKSLPLFFVSGKDDPVGDLGDGVKKVHDIYKEAGILDISYKLYENDRHEILNESDREIVYDDILKWIEKRIK